MKKTWQLEDMPSLKGKTVIVTGGNSGLGYESVKVLAKKNARVILACRSLSRGNEAKSKIMKDQPQTSIEVMALDLSSLDSVRKFADAYKAKHNKLDILLNNAGIMNVPYGKTTDGFEQQIGVNHLGHFALTGLLLDTLKSTPKSRVVVISSLLHKKGHIDFDSFSYNKKRTYDPQVAYAQSKLANLLFAKQLNHLIQKNKLDMTVVSAHPGGAKTNLGRYQDKGSSFNLVKKIIYPLLIQTADQGAMPGLRAATDESVTSGMYIGPSGFMESSGHPYIAKSAPAANDLQTAEKLWKKSESLTGIQYNF
ncbi:oxidoreductase [Acidaminobacter sp. JC074]|uniref:oxidoreductase n=1 Tax=Acidaminobacter sp. JC074 TaxID=2530199 RepID=UPI001F10B817|nr:oxidoreductase [Acidaminobacter sp. JC074]